MKVAYIGNLGPDSAPHSTENHVARALRSHGVEVVEINEQVLTLARWDPTPALDVDFVIWTHTHSFAPPRSHRHQTRFLAAMRERSIPVVSYHLDRYWDLYRESQLRGYGKEPFFCTDLMCSADGGNDLRWEAVGIQHAWFPPGVSEPECVPGTYRPELASDIAFVGSWQGGYHRESRHREQLVAWLRETYGERCRFWPERGAEAVRGERLRDLYASVKVVVGDSCFSGTPMAECYWSDRVPETIGRGGLLIHPDTPGMDAHFRSGEHLLTWLAGDWDALANTIDFALADPDLREEISTAGREHVLATATYEVRMSQLFAQIMGRGLVTSFELA